MEDDDARAIWLAGEEVGRREERARIIEMLDKLACNNVYCREAKIMRTHAHCRAVREHINLIEGSNDK
jgi:hypothetical protein